MTSKNESGITPLIVLLLLAILVLVGAFSVWFIKGNNLISKNSVNNGTAATCVKSDTYSAGCDQVMYSLDINSSYHILFPTLETMNACTSFVNKNPDMFDADGSPCFNKQSFHIRIVPFADSTIPEALTSRKTNNLYTKSIQQDGIYWYIEMRTFTQDNSVNDYKVFNKLVDSFSPSSSAKGIQTKTYSDQDYKLTFPTLLEARKSDSKLRLIAKGNQVATITSADESQTDIVTYMENKNSEYGSQGYNEDVININGQLVSIYTFNGTNGSSDHKIAVFKNGSQYFFIENSGLKEYVLNKKINGGGYYFTFEDLYMLFKLNNYTNTHYTNSTDGYSLDYFPKQTLKETTPSSITIYSGQQEDTAFMHIQSVEVPKGSNLVSFANAYFENVKKTQEDGTTPEINSPFNPVTYLNHNALTFDATVNSFKGIVDDFASESGSYRYILLENKSRYFLIAYPRGDDRYSSILESLRLN